MSTILPIMQKLRCVPLVILIGFGILTLNPTSASAACTSPAGASGDMVYNSTHTVMQFCDGTDWTAMKGDNLGAGGSGDLITDNTIDSSEIENNTITSTDILNSTITGTDILNGSIGVVELSATGTKSINTYLRGNNTWGAVTVTETDPQVGTLTNNKWCRAGSGVVKCDQNPPTLSEADPQVNIVTNGRLCFGTGSAVDCNTTVPSCSGANKALQYTGTSFICTTLTPGGGGTGSCGLPWGGTIANGASVTAYQVAAAANCATQSQTRNCSSGTLSGTYTYQNCTPYSGCPASTVSWGAGCSDSVAATGHGGTRGVSFSSGSSSGYSGSGTATCNNGGWSVSASCTYSAGP